MEVKTKKGSNKQILCVEDHDDTCELYRLLLPEYDFTFAKSLSQALALFKEKEFDLCIMDGWLCDGSGTQLCRTLLDVKPDLPVVFVSGLSRTSDIAAAKKAGATEYLVKPCDTEKLQKVVKQLIER